MGNVSLTPLINFIGAAILLAFVLLLIVLIDKMGGKKKAGKISTSVQPPPGPCQKTTALSPSEDISVMLEIKNRIRQLEEKLAGNTKELQELKKQVMAWESPKKPLFQTTASVAPSSKAGQKKREAPEVVEKKTEIPEDARKKPIAPAAQAQPFMKKGPVSQTIKIPDLTPIPSPIPKGKSVWYQRWERMESQFIQNWTGIIGAILIVVGIGFLGVYTALRCSAFYRFWIIIGFAAILAGMAFFLRNRPIWEKMSLWLRSSAGAILLFACLGAGGIPGLKWISTPSLALEILCLGIAINLLLGFLGRRQIFAVLHVLLSLAALTIAPQNLTIFLIASIVVFCGTIWSYREKWDPTLLIILSLFFLYQWYWQHNQGGALSALSEMPWILGSLSLVNLTAFLAHYRKVYCGLKLGPWPLVAHLANWFYFSMSIFMFAPHLLWKPMVLAAVAVGVFLFAHRAKALGVRWLFYTDVLLSQFLALLALLAMAGWKIDGGMIAGSMFAQILLYSVVVKLENEQRLYQVGITLANLMGLVLMIIGFGFSASIKNFHVILFGCLILGLIFHAYLRWRYQENCDQVIRSLLEAPAQPFPYQFSLFELLLGIFPAVAFYPIHAEPWSGTFILALVLPLIAVREKFQSHGLGLGAVLSLAALFGFGWYQYSISAHWSWLIKIQYGAPLLGLALVGAGWSHVADFKKHLRWLGITLFYFQFMVMTNFLGIHFFPRIFVAGALFLETLAYLLVILKLAQPAACFGMGKLAASLLILVSLSISLYESQPAKVMIMHQSAASLAVMMIFALAGLIFLWKKYPEQQPPQTFSLFELVSGLILAAIAFQLKDTLWGGYAVAGAGIGILYIRQKFQSNSLAAGLLGSLMGIYGVAWSYLLAHKTAAVLDHGIYSLPLFLLPLAVIHWSYVESLKRNLRWIGLTLFYLNALVVTDVICQPRYPWIYILGIMYLETLVYVIALRMLRERAIYPLGMLLANGFALGLIGLAVYNAQGAQTLILYQNAGTLAGCLIAGYLFYLIIQRMISRAGETDMPGLGCLGLLFGIMLISASWNSYTFVGSGYALAALALPLFWIRQKYQSGAIGLGLIFFVLVAHGLSWYFLSNLRPDQFTRALIYGPGLFLISLSCMLFAYVKKNENYVPWFGIYLFSGHFMFASYLIFKPVSHYLPGVLWMGFSILILETAVGLRNYYGEAIAQKGEPDRYFLHTGYMLIAGFFLRHLLVHLQGEGYLFSLIPGRLGIEIFAILVLIYWLTRSRPETGKIYKSWLNLHPLLMECLVLFLVLTLSLEVRSPWHPVAWIVIAFVCWGAGKIFAPNYSRLKIYSLFFSWAAAVNVAIVTSRYVTPSTHWYDQAWMSGCLSILLQWGYLILGHQKEYLASVELPAYLRFLTGLVAGVNTKKNYFLYYPVFISVALFCYWAFDQSALTLLWVGECFIIFVLSIALRENHFRYVAFGGLIFCLVRLVIYDLARTQTLIRALVFLGVGIILILMNTLYTKYRDRLR